MQNWKKAKELRCLTVEILPLRAVLLACCTAMGFLCAFALSGRCGEETIRELKHYLAGFLLLVGNAKAVPEAAWETLVCFFRAPVLAFLLGFASVGVVLLPVLFAAQGFCLSFSLFCFAQALGREGFWLLPVLFGVRLASVVPCTMVLGTAAFEKSRGLALLSLGNGKRARPVTYGSAYWLRFWICCACLLLGGALELWLVPRFLAMAVAA